MSEPPCALGVSADHTAPQSDGLPHDSNISKFLGSLASLATSAVPHVHGATVCVAGPGGHPTTLIATSAAVRAVDDAQHSASGGPCLQAIVSGQEVTADVPAEQWPEFSRSARQLGVSRVTSVPLEAPAGALGVLNLYTLAEVPWDGPRPSSARLLAGQAAMALTEAFTLAKANHANANLREALATRTVIGQAQGILMARQGINAEQAFDVLRRASQRSNRKLRDIAADVVADLSRR